MQEPNIAPKVARFGLFEVDFASQELRKSGIKIKIQDQPFQILALLLERPGQIVTRDEIQKRLWAGDTFVDFDLGLNSAVKKLRQALGDESENPRFIETLYRRGYRFLAPIHADLAPSVPSGRPLPQPSGNGGASSHSAYASAQVQIPTATQKKSSSHQWLYVALPVMLGIALFAGYSLRPASLPRITGYQEITHDGRQKYELASDGERLYLEEYDAGRFEIAQVSAFGGESSVLPTPFTNPMLAGVLPHASALLIGDMHDTEKQSQLWSLPLPTGAPRRIGDFVVQAVAGSPDGKSLAFSDGNAIYQAAADGAQVKKLLAIKGPAYNIAFSPDSRKICFNLSNTLNGTSTLWMANADGSNLRRVFPESEDSQHDSDAKWTPDGKYLLFERVHEGHQNVWALPLSKSWFSREPQALQLTNGPLDFGIPLPSRDGRRIFAVGAQPRTELLRFDGKSAFRPFLGGISVTDLAFSADGQWVTYVTIPDKTLWRSRTDGSERLQLTDAGKIWAGLPRWSPDGKQIVFMGKTNTSNWRAYLISSAGGPFQDLVPTAPAGFDPNWMPDGKSIVLSLANLGPTAQGVSLLDLKTGKITDLPDSNKYFSPRPSPDGRYIAAVTTDSQVLTLFDSTTQRWTELVKLPMGYPSWSHDGQFIYFDSVLSDDPAFYRVRISDHKLERLVSLSSIRRFWGEMAEWAGLTPDDSLLLTRDASNHEVYAIDWSPN